MRLNGQNEKLIQNDYYIFDWKKSNTLFHCIAFFILSLKLINFVELAPSHFYSQEKRFKCTFFFLISKAISIYWIINIIHIMFLNNDHVKIREKCSYPILVLFFMTYDTRLGLKLLFRTVINAKNFCKASDFLYSFDAIKPIASSITVLHCLLQFEWYAISK